MNIRSLDLPVRLPAGDESLRCIGRLQEGLARIKGVTDASVNNAHDTLHIAYDPHLVTFSRLESEVRRQGAEINVSVEHATLLLEGMDSPDAVPGIERVVGMLDGVLWAGANFAAAQLHVEFRRDQVRLPDIIARIEAQGMRAVHRERDTATESRKPRLALPAGPWTLLTRRAGQTVLGACLAVAALLVQLMESAGGHHPISPYLWAAALLAGGWTTLRAAIAALRSRAVDMNVLLTIAVLGAAVLGEWAEAMAVVLLYDVGILLQTRVLERVRRSLYSLTELTPPTARVLRNSMEQSLPVSEIGVNDTILIRPGERIPLDGVITSGTSAIQEALITGERTPVEKSPDSLIFAGTINGQGTLEVRVTRPYSETVLAQVLHGVEEAQAQRSPAERLLDRFARRYTPLVFWLAVGVAVVPPLMAGGDFSWYFSTWLHRGLSLLLIACPLGLILAAPVAIAVALGTAARRGVLIKGGTYLETIGTVKAVVYDKTGTLTEGVLKVEDVVPFSSMTCAEILSYAAVLESQSAHPVAQAITQAAERHPPSLPYQITGLAELPGRGIRATIDGTPCLLGSPALFAAQKLPLAPEVETALEEAESVGNTCVLLGYARTLQGMILLRDKPRPEAKAAIAALHRQGILYQAMLTGDTTRVAAQVAAVAGLEEYQSGLTPEKKLQHIQHLQHRYGRVAMVGDGIQDTPALAAADIGLVMGVAGSDTALLTADIALLRDDLSCLPSLIRLSRSTRAIVRQNTALALITSVVLVGAAMLATLPLWLVLLGNVGVALLVTINALRLVEEQDRVAQTVALMEESEDAEALLDLVFINDKTVDEQPEAGHVYPTWERFVVSFTGAPIRFGRKASSSMLPVQIEDTGMSRLHGEIRMEGGRPVVVDLQSTNGIRFNAKTQGALIPPLRPTPLRFGDNLLIGHNTRIEVRRPGEFGVGARIVSGVRISKGMDANEEHTQNLRSKSGVTTS
jgi:Cd2+/Zn2+-exporting ATPase